MKKLILIFILLLFSVSSAQDEADSLNIVIDSLYIRATTAMLRYQDDVQAAKDALIEMGESAMPRLVEKMDTQDARSMHALVFIFKGIGRPAVHFLTHAIGDTDSFRRRLAVRSLGDMKDSTAVDGLLYYIDDPDFRIRSGIIRAFGKIGVERGVAPSIEALSDDDYLVRTAAAISLSMLADPSTINQLYIALSDPYYGVRFKAADGLANIGDQAIGFIKEKLKTDFDKDYFYLLIEASGKTENKNLIKPLTRIVQSDDPIARAYALEAIGKIDMKKAGKIAKKRLKNESHPFVLGKIDLLSEE